jgi:hypothetical protein
MPQYWFIVEALVTLGAHRKGVSKPFTPLDLKRWSEQFGKRPAGVRHALDHLERCGMVRRIPRPADAKPAKQGAWTYLLTPEGAAAALAARDARARAGMSRGCTNANQAKPRDKSSFTARLWALLRMRTTLTAAEAAATLVDAGADVAKVTRTASTYMRTWVRLHPKAIQISAQCGANGAYRFVLVKDLGPEGPVISNKRLQGGAAA